MRNIFLLRFNGELPHDLMLANTALVIQSLELWASIQHANYLSVIEARLKSFDDFCLRKAFIFAEKRDYFILHSEINSELMDTRSSAFQKKARSLVVTPGKRQPQAVTGMGCHSPN